MSAGLGESHQSINSETNPVPSSSFAPSNSTTSARTSQSLPSAPKFPAPLLDLSRGTPNPHSIYANLDDAQEPQQIEPPLPSASTRPLPHLSQPLPPSTQTSADFTTFTIRKQQPRANSNNNGMAPGPFASGEPAPKPSAPLAPSPSSGNASLPSTVFPALHLIPLNETFVPKQIALQPQGARVKIGRQTNAKTIPNGSNGYFDSKVLSRMHAEVWSEDGKVLIKDVKSSNGTFIDGQRLSAEAAESDVFELRTGSTVEFGIDIVSDDSKTIVHHKVAAKVHVVMNSDDALASSREFTAWYRNAGDQPNQRRGARPLGQQGPQQNGLSFEHVLNRLQGELQKSRDTGSNLGDLSSTLNDVQDTLGGGAPPPNFASSQRGMVPSYITNGHSSSASADSHAQSIAALQSQLNETQQSLAGHVGKIRDLEGLLAEHDVIKREVGGLRKQMEEAKRDMERMMMREKGSGFESESGKGEVEDDPDMIPRPGGGGSDGRESPVAKLLEAEEAEEQEHDRQEDDDDDDARSISSVDTISPSNASSKTQSQSNGDLSPSATSPDSSASSSADPTRSHLLEQNALLSARLEALSSSLSAATALGASLRTAHAEASSTIRLLEARVQGLEREVEGRVKEVEGRVMSEMGEWRRVVEEGWKREREGWEEERGKLKEIVREWEERRTRREGSSGSSEEEDDSTDEDEEHEDPEADEGPRSTRDITSAAFDSNPSSSTTSPNPRPTTKSKRSRSRRRRRTTAIAPTSATLVSGPGGRDLTTARGGSNQQSGSEREGSRSSSSGEAVKRGWDSATAGAGAGGGAGRHQSDNSRALSNSSAAPSPYASAGAVVVIGVIAAYALSLKLKE